VGFPTKLITVLNFRHIELFQKDKKVIEMSLTLKEYDAKLDSKKRLTIRGARTNYYHVTEKKDGTIELSPRELVHPDEISKNTLKMVDKAVTNFKNGEVSEPVNIAELEELLD
jgi:hypothetical protein